MSTTNKDEDVWLVEKAGLCIGSCGNKLRWVTFTDPNALKFKTEHGAKVFIRKENIKGATAINHLFCAPSSST